MAYKRLKRVEIERIQKESHNKRGQREQCAIEGCDFFDRVGDKYSRYVSYYRGQAYCPNHIKLVIIPKPKTE